VGECDVVRCGDVRGEGVRGVIRCSGIRHEKKCQGVRAERVIVDMTVCVTFERTDHCDVTVTHD
jgi:hypothetical protein